MKYKITFQKNNQIHTKILEANNIHHLRSLEEYPDNIIHVEKINSFKAYKLNINAEDYYNFFYELNILLKSHLSFIDALSLLSQNSYKNQIDIMIKMMIDALKNGKEISSELKKDEKIPYIIIVFLQNAQKNGNYIDSISGLCDIFLLKKQMKLKIIKVLWYPIFLFITMISSMIIMLFYVLPEFEYMFTQLDQTLPLGTQILLKIKYFGVHYYLDIVFFVFSLGVLFLWYKKNYQEKYHYVLFKKIYFISSIYESFINYQLFIIILKSLQSKQKITDTLSFLKDSTSNIYLNKKIDNIVHLLNSGIPISKAFEEQNIYEPSIIKLLRIADSTNNYIEIFTTLVYVTKNKLEKKIDTFSKVIEPILIVILGTFLLFMILAVLSPVWEFGKIS